MQLNLSGERINLISPRPLAVGQLVMLTRTDAQQVSLSPLQPQGPALHTHVQQPAVQQALREALPQQIPFGDALNQLVQLSQTPAARSQGGAINQLVHSMLSLFSVSPGSEDAGEAIKRNLQQGGLLTEARLGQAGAEKSAPQADLKQQLGQLLKAAERLPEEARQQMTRLVDALQARSTSQQVSSLQAWREQPDGSMERVYRLDLPIRQAERFDNAELSITERHERQADGEMLVQWSAALHFDLETYGSVDARLSLQEDWRLQLQFWAEQAQTQRLINNRLEPFTQGLHQQGFLVDNVQVHAGRPSQPELTEVQRRLVDVHT
ncbi:MAG: flagellar hook-length control protein FliK [Marinobacterium sp.]